MIKGLITSEAELERRLARFEEWDPTLCELLLSTLERLKVQLGNDAKSVRELVDKLKDLAQKDEDLKVEVESLLAENDAMREKLERIEGMGGLETIERLAHERDLLWEHAYGRVDWDDGTEEVMLLAERLEEEMG